MNFINKMNVKAEVDNFRLYNKINFNNCVELSVQASYGHYCNPRKTTHLNEYNNMELAILKNDEFVTISDVTNDKCLIERLNSCFEGTVYGFVPIELIEELYLTLSQQKVS